MNHYNQNQLLAAIKEVAPYLYEIHFITMLDDYRREILKSNPDMGFIRRYAFHLKTVYSVENRDNLPLGTSGIEIREIHKLLDIIALRA